MKMVHVLPLVFSVGLFGCSNTQNQEQNQVAESSATKRPKSFVSQLPDSAPVIKVATTGVTPPFSFQDDYGNMQGIDIDVIREIGEEQGFKVEFYKEPWVELFDSVASGERDMALAGISYKPERDQKYGLSNPYFFNPSAIMYQNDGLKITKLEDLKGLKVGGMLGGKSIKQVQDMGGYSELVSADTPFLLFEKLVQGEVQAITNDYNIWRYISKNHPEHNVHIVPYESESDPSAQQVILMAKNNDDLIHTVNQGIAKLKQAGKLEKIEEKWLGDSAESTAESKQPSATNQAAKLN